MSLQIQLKKSAVSQKQPFASDLAVGELALNYNANGPFLTCKDSAGNVRKLNNVWVATAAPNNPSAGDLWLDTSAATAVLKVYKDSTSTWVNATTIPVATTSIFGSVQLASAADITNATAGKVVDAAQLQSKISAELSANPITFQGVNVVNNVTIGGDLTVNGTQTIINTTTLDVEDKNIVIGNVATPSNTTADGGGISLLGATTKTLNWVNATGAWTSSERFSVPVGSAAAPSLTFTGDPDTGIYNSAANQVSISTAGTERLRIDPNGQLHAVSLGAAATPTFSFTTDTNTGIYSPGADQLAISTGGTGRLFVDASGNVCIAKSPSVGPTYSKSLTIAAQDASIALRANSAGTYTDQGIFFAVDGTNYSQIYNDGIGQLIFRTGSGLGERLRITSAGLVGIGTSSPSKRLTIIQDGADSALRIEQSGQGYNLYRNQPDGLLYFEGPQQTFSGFNFRVTPTGGSTTSALWIDNSGRVGIGTVSPSNRLDVLTAVDGLATVGRFANISNLSSATASAFDLQADQAISRITTVRDGSGTSAATVISNTAAGVMTERLRITSAGLVGVGTSSPAFNFVVAGSGSDGAWFNSSGTVGRMGLGSIAAGAGGAFQISYDRATGLTSFGVGTRDTPSTAFNIDVNGRLGIGTTSPSVPLVVSAAASPQIQLIRPTGVDLRLNAQFANTDLASLSVVSNHPLAFHTNNTERARFDSVGRFLIGTSTAVGSSTGVQGFLQHQSSDTGTAANANFGRWTNDTGGYALYFAKSRGTSVGTQGLVSDGDFLGALFFEGSDGTQLRRAASITANVDGTPGTNSMPGRIVLSTTASGASSPTERLRITSAGNVGIGSPNPAANLEVLSSSVSVIRAATTDATGASIAGIQLDNLGAGASSLIARAGGNYTILTSTTNTPLIFGTNNTERARIDSSGRLLVGTSTARTNYFNSTGTAQLQIEGVGTAAATASITCDRSLTAAAATLALNKSAGDTVGSNTLVSSDDTLGVITFQGNDGTEFVQAASISAFTDGTPGANSMPGRIVLSTTASGASSPTERLRISSTGTISTSQALSSTTVFSIINSSNTSSQTLLEMQGGTYTTSDTTTKLIVFKRGDGTEIGSVIRNGATTVNYATSSDYRLKENIKPLTGALAKFNTLKPSRFNFIGDTRTVDGFIAHEVQPVVPEAITGEKDAVDEDGNPIYQGIDQSKLVPLLTAALQEAIAKIESLEARLSAAGI